MAVYQTRAWFKNQHGHLTDNPEVGPLLAQHYWAPGNSVSHNDSLLSLTGEGFSGRFLAAYCNRSVEEAWHVAETDIAAAAQRPQPPVQALQASMRVVHGEELIADNSVSDAEMFNGFERWIHQRYHRVDSG